MVWVWIAVVLLAAVTRWYLGRTPLNKLPSPRRFPIVGSLPLLDPERPMQSMEKMAALGKLVRLRIFSDELVLVRDLPTIQQILERQAAKYFKPITYARGLGLFLGEKSLIVCNGEDHKSARNTVGKFFVHDSLLSLSPTILGKCEGFANWIRDQQGKEFDFEPRARQFFLDIIAKVGFGAELGLIEDPERGTAFVDAFNTTLSYTEKKAQGLPSFLIGRNADSNFANARDMIRGAAREMIDSRLQNGVGDDETDILAQLVRNGAGQTEEGKEWLENECTTFLFAGSDTTAGTLMFSLYELSTKQELQDALRRELRAACGSDVSGISVDTVRDLPLLNAVINETLRLYPSAPIVARASQEPLQAEGFTIPPNTVLIISPWIVHRCEEYWPNASSFNPDRFINPQHDRAAFIPFLNGPRNCVGRHMAKLNLQLSLAYMLLSFSVQRSETAPEVDIINRTTLGTKNGLYLRFVPL